MFEFFKLVVAWQLYCFAGSFTMGLGLLAYLYSRYWSRKWKITDLIWVGCGGVAALTATIASIYITNSSLLARQADVVFSSYNAVLSDSRRFYTRNCKAGRAIQLYESDIETICSKILVIIDSIYNNARIEMLAEISETSVGDMPLSSGYSLSKFHEWLGVGKSLSFGESLKRDVWSFENKFGPIRDIFGSETNLVEPFDTNTSLAFGVLERSGLYFDLLADFEIIAGGYTGMTEKLTALDVLWLENQRNLYFLALRVFALSLLFFAFPLRVGKSLAELKFAT